MTATDTTHLVLWQDNTDGGKARWLVDLGNDRTLMDFPGDADGKLLAIEWAMTYGQQTGMEVRIPPCGAI